MTAAQPKVKIQKQASVFSLANLEELFFHLERPQMLKTKKESWEIVNEFVHDAGLKRHMGAVGVAMKFYATKLGFEPEYWESVGVIHDFDWEIHPDLDQHPMDGAEILRNRGWDDETIRIILSHYTAGTGIAREKPIDFALLACDELTGLIIATTLVRPSKDIADVKLKSLRKKWKDRRFAAGVNREHVLEATADFSLNCFDGNLDLWQHMENVLLAMQSDAVTLQLDGTLGNR